MRALPLLILTACSDPGSASFGDPVDDPQVPPRGFQDIDTWLEAGFYEDWSCEAERHPPLAGSGHGANRICSNDVLVAADGGSGVFPIGAASVKEIFDGGELVQYAVYRKMTDGADDNSWYWYEGLGDDVVANAEGDGTCTGCHGRAPRDFVYSIIVP